MHAEFMVMNQPTNQPTNEIREDRQSPINEKNEKSRLFFVYSAHIRTVSILADNKSSFIIYLFIYLFTVFFVIFWFRMYNVHIYGT